MRKYGYKRPTATLLVRRPRPVRRYKRPSLFFKFLTRFFLLLVIGGGAFFALRYGWQVFSRAQITNWQVKKVVIAGVNAQQTQEISALAAPFEGKPFSSTQANQLRGEIVKQYPMLKNVSVSRGLLSGKLKISARPREPMARLVLPTGSPLYLDKDNFVYADPAGPQAILQVKLLGEVPEQLPATFVEQIQHVLRLKKELPFEALELDTTANTVTLRLPDKSIIRFGPAQDLKAKAARAVQIRNIADGKYAASFTLDFTFFDYGKVFLTQNAR